MKTFTTKSNKEIKIWDGLVDYVDASFFFQYAINSLYRIGWSDGDSEEQIKYKYLYSSLTMDECISSKVFPVALKSEIAEELKGATFAHAMINLSSPADIHFPHAHANRYVLLYYANPIWRTHWYGETLFYNETATEIELALPYTPHRLVLFDGEIPHSIRPQSRDAETHRFTFAMVFDKSNAMMKARQE